jgi:DNA helicase HerA-like ATPase
MADTHITRKIIDETSPIRRLLAPEHVDEIGAIFRLDGYRDALVITNDRYVAEAVGVPQHAFLLGAMREVFDRSGDVLPHADEELVLMRVVDTTPLPDEGEAQRLRAQIGRDLVTDNRRDPGRRRGPDGIVDPLTLNEVQTFGLKCAVLGTFYDDDDGNLAFGSDIDTIYAARRMLVYKPHGKSLETIGSFLVRENADTTRPSMDVELGTLRYASTRRRERLADAANKPVAVPIRVDISDFVAHKTAVFGMTRLGKSNTMKVIATSVFKYSKEKNVKIGQLIFDPAAEYAEVNEQDGTALALVSKADVRRYKFAARKDELDADPSLRALALNLFDEDEIEPAWSLVTQYVLNRRTADYTTAFAAADISGPEQGDPDFSSLMTRARRARGLVYAMLIKAGIETPSGWDYHLPMSKVFRDVLASLTHHEGRDLKFLAQRQTSKGPHGVSGLRLNARELQTVAEGICHNAVQDPRHPEVANWYDGPDNRNANLAKMLMAWGVSGYKLLYGLDDGYHSPAANKDYGPAIYEDLVAGRLVIVDLSRGSQGVVQFASERVINHLLERSAEKFRQGLPLDYIQVFLEEAHKLFDRDKFKQSESADPYVRLAREAGKYRIGMIYSTQQVSSVEPDVLDNTANWVVAHLNSESEVRLLRDRYEFSRFAEQIKTAEDRGFIRLKTLSSRYIVPVQVRRFDADMVSDAQRAAETAAKQVVEEDEARNTTGATHEIRF